MERYKEARNASILGILGNSFLLIIKLVIGLVTNSRAMLADATNSASDIFSSIMTFLGNKIASKDRDEDHNLGHGKAEYFFSLLVSLTMFLLFINIMSDSVKSIIYGNNMIFNKWLIIVCIITIITKLCLYYYTHNVSVKYKNLLMEANAKDHRNDVLLTSLTLLSAVFSYFGIALVDSIVGILIAIWIFITSLQIFMDSYNVLMDKSISIKEKERVLKIIKKHPEIKGVQHFNSTPVGYKYQISLTIFVDGNLSTFESHRIADELEKEILSSIEDIYLAVIHVNPIEIEENK